MKKKSEISVRDACKKAFEKSPETFKSNNFIAMVRIITGRPGLHDETIMRRLRELRADYTEFQYKCVDTEKSLYKKIT